MKKKSVCTNEAIMIFHLSFINDRVLIVGIGKNFTVDSAESVGKFLVEFGYLITKSLPNNTHTLK